MSSSHARMTATAVASQTVASSEVGPRFAPTLPCVRSQDLFGKDREIIIEHCGMQYHLRLTKANKLILTK